MTVDNYMGDHSPPVQYKYKTRFKKLINTNISFE